MPNNEGKCLALVVDDDLFLRKWIIKELEDRVKVKCETADNTKEGIAKFDEYADEMNRSFDFVVLDMHMPLDEDEVDVDEEAGVHLIRVISRFHLKNPACAIIVFTAHPSPENQLDAIMAGASAYLAKHMDLKRRREGADPFQIDQLIKMCQHLLNKKETGEISADGETNVSMPGVAWVRENYEKGLKKLVGKWVAFIPEKTAEVRSFFPEDECIVLGGFVVAHAVSPARLRQILLSSDLMPNEYPPIAKIG